MLLVIEHPAPIRRILLVCGYQVATVGATNFSVSVAEIIVDQVSPKKRTAAARIVISCRRGEGAESEHHADCQDERDNTSLHFGFSFLLDFTAAHYLACISNEQIDDLKMAFYKV